MNDYGGKGDGGKGDKDSYSKAERGKSGCGEEPSPYGNRWSSEWWNWVSSVRGDDELWQLVVQFSEKEAEATETLEQARSMVPCGDCMSALDLDHCKVTSLRLRHFRHSFTKAAELMAPMVCTVADLCNKFLSHASVASGQNGIVLRECSNQLTYIHEVLLTFLNNMYGWQKRMDERVKMKQLEKCQKMKQV